MSDPIVLRMRAKVQLAGSDELEKLEPARQAIVEITLNDGTVLSNRVTAVRGTADNPMPRDEVITKCRDLIEPVLGKAKAGQLIQAVMGIEALSDVRTLRGMLQKT
jgi:2-methylcitrate dehydratase PrpD